jgi:Tfp pilus assembly protein PilN
MRINLLPPEIRERQRYRRRTAAVVLIGIIVLAALGAFYVLQVMRLADVEEDLEAQRAENAELQQEIAQLQRFAELEQELQDTRTLLNTLLADKVLWSGVLRDVSLVIPGEMWLSGLSGAAVGATTAEGETTTTTTTGAPVVPGGGLVAQITFNGFAFDHRDVALWLSRLEDVRGFVNPWLSNSQKTLIGQTEVVQFTSSVDLTEQALARTGGQA